MKKKLEMSDLPHGGGSPCTLKLRKILTKFIIDTSEASKVEIQERSNINISTRLGFPCNQGSVKWKRPGNLILRTDKG